jgi:hypothetical protein
MLQLILLLQNHYHPHQWLLPLQWRLLLLNQMLQLILLLQNHYHHLLPHQWLLPLQWHLLLLNQWHLKLQKIPQNLWLQLLRKFLHLWLLWLHSRLLHQMLRHRKLQLLQHLWLRLLRELQYFL